MKRYIDFRADDWFDRTDSRMQAARWAACMEGLAGEPPLSGVIDTYPEDLLHELLSEGWLGAVGAYPVGGLRQALRDAVRATLEDDADCLAIEEHTLVERMLIGDGRVALGSVAEAEAAYTLRMRMWCDVGVEGDEPVARLDPALLDALPAVLMRQQHVARRGRVFIFDGMLHGLLYITGTLDMRMPREHFIREVLEMDLAPHTMRLARNFLEASFDTYTLAGRDLLVHEALADPEALAGDPPMDGMDAMPEITSGAMAASMNGLLPEETIPDEKLQRALHGALRPEYETGDASSDLRFLAKQDAPVQTMREIMASMLFVLPTQHMDSALQELRLHTPRWVRPPENQSRDGMLH